MKNIIFLEIELLSEKENKNNAKNLIYLIAEELGITNPNNNILNGGFREERGYVKLINLAKNNYRKFNYNI